MKSSKGDKAPGKSRRAGKSKEDATSNGDVKSGRARKTSGKIEQRPTQSMADLVNETGVPGETCSPDLALQVCGSDAGQGDQPEDQARLSAQASGEKVTGIERQSQPLRQSVFERIQGLEMDQAEELQLAIEQRNLLIGAWHARERLYNELFGKYDHVSPQYYGPPGELTELSQNSQQSELGGTGDPGQPDLADQHLTILTYAPDPLRPYWTYVTAGLCSPWLQQRPDEVSGFGCELMIKSPHRASWPAQVLRSLAFYIFNHAGTISPGVRISLNGPIDPATESRIRNLFVWYADEAPDCWYQLPSGGFGIFTAVGITDDELMYAESVEEYGTWCIQEVLRKFGINQVSDPARQSVTTLENVDAIMRDIKELSDNFRQSGLAGLM